MNSGTPHVSVVMPVRCGAAYLDAAIQSILCQTFADFEFIIIDDGSTDDTAEILDRAAKSDGRIRLLRTSGEGIVIALNIGIRAAQGALLARMDADDVAMPERLAAQVEAMSGRPELVALGTFAIITDAQGVETGRSGEPCDAATSSVAILKRNIFLHPTMMLRREAVLAAGLYRPACIYAEDYDLWLRLSEIGGMANMEQSLMRLRVHPAQTSTVKRMTQRAATAFARQLAKLRRAGRPEGVDTRLPLAASLAAFLMNRAQGQEPIFKAELADWKMMLRHGHHGLNSTASRSLFSLLRPYDTFFGHWAFRIRLAFQKRMNRQATAAAARPQAS